MQAARFIITGRVQGVSFRYYAKEKALQLGLEGWVKNLPTGQVESVAQGPKDMLETFHQWLHTGSPHSVVEEVLRESVKPDPTLVDFSIRY